MILLEFNITKGYAGLELNGHDSIKNLETLKSLPIIKWCERHLGSMFWPVDKNSAPAGPGWQLQADWTEFQQGTLDKPRVFLIVNDTIPEQLLTDFWIRFQ